MSHGLLNSATHIFTCLQRLFTISDCRRIVKVCCPNQIKNHHFVICRALTSYLSLNFIITNNYPTELQSPRGHQFCLLCWSTFYELSRVTPNVDGFSGVLRDVSSTWFQASPTSFSSKKVHKLGCWTHDLLTKFLNTTSFRMKKFIGLHLVVNSWSLRGLSFSSEEGGPKYTGGS